MKTNRTHRAGYLIIEFLFAIGILGVFSLVASHLFVADFKLMQQNPLAIESAARFDAAVKMLRTDITTASTMRLQDAHTLNLQTSDNESVSWRLTPLGLLRETSNTHQSWEISQPLDLKQDGAILLLHASTNSDDSADIAFAIEPKNDPVKK